MGRVQPRVGPPKDSNLSCRNVFSTRFCCITSVQPCCSISIASHLLCDLHFAGPDLTRTTQPSACTVGKTSVYSCLEQQNCSKRSRGAGLQDKLIQSGLVVHPLSNWKLRISRHLALPSTILAKSRSKLHPAERDKCCDSIPASLCTYKSMGVSGLRYLQYRMTTCSVLPSGSEVPLTVYGLTARESIGCGSYFTTATLSS